MTQLAFKCSSEGCRASELRHSTSYIKDFSFLATAMPLDKTHTALFTFIRCLCPKRLTVIHTDFHTLMVLAAMQGASEHIRNSLGFSVLPKDTLICRPGETNQRPSDDKTLALPLSHRRPKDKQQEVIGPICIDI